MRSCRPYFQTPQPIAEREIVPLMNSGRYTFVLDIPPNFQRDVLGGRQPAIQLNVDATAMVQAGLGASYAQQIITTEINNFLSRAEGAPLSPVNLVVRIAFNPNVTTAWFTSVMGIINSITMLAIILAGAAVVREREHGTMDHLLVMPLTAVRDRDVQDLGERPRHHRRGRACRFISSCAGCSASRSPARYRCSCSASRSICSLPPRSASSSAPSRARCPSSACSICWSFCR